MDLYYKLFILVIFKNFILKFINLSIKLKRLIILKR
jgi:hypothetical protein